MSFVPILYLLCLVAGFLPAIRFQKNKFFYFFYVTAAVDPVYSLLNKIIPIHSSYLYFGIVALLIMWSLPNKAYRWKIIITASVLVSYLRFEDNYWLTLILVEIAVMYTAIVITDYILDEVKLSKQVSIFLILLLIDQILNSIKAFLYFDDIAKTTATYPYMLMSGVIIYIAIAIIGGDRKTSLLSLFLKHSGNDIEVTFTDEEKLISGNVKKYFHGNGLTEIDNQILKLISEDYTSSQIADIVHLSKKTIDKHRHDIRKKLNLPPKSDIKIVAKKIHPNNNNDNNSI